MLSVASGLFGPPSLLGSRLPGPGPARGPGVGALPAPALGHGPTTKRFLPRQTLPGLRATLESLFTKCFPSRQALPGLRASSASGLLGPARRAPRRGRAAGSGPPGTKSFLDSSGPPGPQCLPKFSARLRSRSTQGPLEDSGCGPVPRPGGRDFGRASRLRRLSRRPPGPRRGPAAELPAAVCEFLAAPPGNFKFPRGHRRPPLRPSTRRIRAPGRRTARRRRARVFEIFSPPFGGPRGGAGARATRAPGRPRWVETRSGLRRAPGLGAPWGARIFPHGNCTFPEK